MRRDAAGAVSEKILSILERDACCTEPSTECVLEVMNPHLRQTGAKARLMAQYMHIHALEATGGYTYAQMGIYTAKPGTPKAQLMPGGGTENTAFAAIDPNTKQPLQNGARQVWVTETALAAALNMSFMAGQVALFGIVVGIALLLSGFGFAILAIGGALRNPQTALGFLHRSSSKVPAVPVA